mmetsp:Transcript_26988/g.89827  ORF Transcript_26988/g.89827 Transcript_26988/m.89827 type:complete len:237 (-) Transcript_26988:338-1048(-)
MSTTVDTSSGSPCRVRMSLPGSDCSAQKWIRWSALWSRRKWTKVEQSRQTPSKSRITLGSCGAGGGGGSTVIESHAEAASPNFQKATPTGRSAHAATFVHSRIRLVTAATAPESTSPLNATTPSCGPSETQNTRGDRSQPTAPRGYSSSGLPAAERRMFSAATCALSSAVCPSCSSPAGREATSPIPNTRDQPEAREPFCSAGCSCGVRRSRRRSSSCEAREPSRGAEAGGAPMHG